MAGDNLGIRFGASLDTRISYDASIDAMTFDGSAISNAGSFVFTSNNTSTEKTRHYHDANWAYWDVNSGLANGFKFRYAGASPFSGMQDMMEIHPVSGTHIPVGDDDATWGLTTQPSLTLGENGVDSTRGTIKMWGRTDNAYGFLQMTNGNLHMDVVGGDMYLGFYDSLSVRIGTGAQAVFNSAGDLTITDGGSPFIALVDTTNSARLLMQAGDTTAVIGTSSAHNTHIISAGADRYVIEAGNNNHNFQNTGGQVMMNLNTSSVNTVMTLKDASAVTKMQFHTAGDSYFDSGDWSFSTATNTKHFYISRLANDKTQAIKFGVDDGNGYMTLKQDEVSTEAHLMVYDVESAATGQHGHVFNINGTTHFKILDANTIASTNIDPAVDNTLDLGGSALSWRNLYLQGTLYDGAGANGVSVANIKTAYDHSQITVNSNPHGARLQDLTEVTAPSPSFNDVLTWKGTDWQPNDLSATYAPTGHGHSQADIISGSIEIVGAHDGWYRLLAGGVGDDVNALFNLYTDDGRVGSRFMIIADVSVGLQSGSGQFSLLAHSEKQGSAQVGGWRVLSTGTNDLILEVNLSGSNTTTWQYEATNYGGNAFFEDFTTGSISSGSTVIDIAGGKQMGNWELWETYDHGAELFSVGKYDRTVYTSPILNVGNSRQLVQTSTDTPDGWNESSNSAFYNKFILLSNNGFALPDIGGGQGDMGVFMRSINTSGNEISRLDVWASNTSPFDDTSGRGESFIDTLESLYIRDYDYVIASFVSGSVGINHQGAYSSSFALMLMVTQVLVVQSQ